MLMAEHQQRTGQEKREIEDLLIWAHTQGRCPCDCGSGY